MASRRDLKKNVNYIIGELFTESLIRCVNASAENKVKLEAVMRNILTVQNEFVTRINHTETGNEKLFYKKFRKDFNEQIESIVKEINEIN